LNEILKRNQKLSGTKRTKEEVDDQDNSEDSQSPKEEKKEHKKFKREEKEDSKANKLDEKLKKLAKKKTMVQSGSTENRRPFTFVSVLQKAKSNLDTEK
jgi:hypothetical protein